MSRWRRRLWRENVDKYGGHHGVTRSLVEGLQGLPIRWTYKTVYRDQTADTIVVLSDPGYVRVAIDAKRRGLCDRVVAGPNVATLPSLEGRVLTNESIDILLAPSQWTKDGFESTEPSVTGRVAIWPSGVNTDVWRPSDRKKDTIIVYEKGKPQLAAAVVQTLGNAGFKTKLLVYGKHRTSEYKKALDTALACVVLNEGETQGLAQFEAWSMGVPTFVHVQMRHPHLGVALSAAPYLSEQTGAFWTELSELRPLAASIAQYSPRQWVLENGTDRLSARRLLAILGFDPAPQAGAKIL